MSSIQKSTAPTNGVLGNPAPTPAGVAEALEMVRAGLRFVAAADATQMTVAEQAKCLLGLERADAVAVAARTSVLGAFNAGRATRRTGITARARGCCTGPRSPGYRRGAYRMGQAVSPRIRRSTPRWQPRRSRSPTPGRSAGGPASCRKTPVAAADDILLAAAAVGAGPGGPGGAGRGDVREVPAGQARHRRRRQDGDGNPGETAFDDRAVKLATTIGGAGVIHGALTPECAEFVQDRAGRAVRSGRGR